MVTEDYVSFETAKLLKEKGFDGFCHRYYRCDKEDIDGNGKMFMFASDLNGFCYVTNSLLKDYGDEHEETILAPTLPMVMKWLRKEYNIHIEPRYFPMPNIYRYVIIRSPATIENIDSHPQYFNSHEEACEAAIKYCLEILI